MNIFLDCQFENDYSGLIAEGTPPESEVEKAWNNLFLEYLELMRSKNYNEAFEKTKEINVLHARILLVESICNHLRMEFQPEMIAMLDKFNLKPGITGKESAVELERKLTLICNKAKKWQVQIDIKKAELKKIDVDGHGKQSTRSSYEDMLSAISKHAGYYVRESDITVARYCREITGMIDRAAKQNLKNKTGYGR